MAATFKARLQDIPFPNWPRQHVAYWLMGIEVRSAFPGLGVSETEIRSTLHQIAITYSHHPVAQLPRSCAR